MGKRYVLDTSAIISGKNIPLDIEIYIPESVLNEIEFREKYQTLLDRSRIVKPSREYTEYALKAARETGDIFKLSDTDLDVIALTLELDAVALTDDFAIQNVLRHLGKDYMGMVEGEIKHEYRWVYRCKGCKRYFNEYHEVCPYCGSGLKLVRKKI